jgi:putative ABC transport system permease protein
MTRHVFKLVWNRRRSSGLILVEILISFLVLCAVLTVGLKFLRLSREPLGYEYADRWEIHLGGFDNVNASEETGLANKRQMREVLASVRQLPEVVAASLAFNTPFSTSSMQASTWAGGEEIDMLVGSAQPELREVLELELLSGRWLEEADLAHDWTSVVLSRNLARAIFGLDDPLGRDMPLYDDGQPREPESESEIRRVVGVVSDYKKRGRLDPSPYTMFQLVDLDDPESWLPHWLLLRLQPGTPRTFEERLVEAMRGAAPDWTFEVEVLADRRERSERDKLMPLLIGGTVAAFLILMVGLGLVGVLYQSVVRRTEEMGLRRALGASGVGVRRQVLSEMLALTTIAVVVGAVLFLQAPLLGVLGAIPISVVIVAVILAALLIYSFVTVCGLYPSWLATRIQPAEALQYE